MEIQDNKKARLYHEKKNKTARNKDRAKNEDESAASETHIMQDVGVTFRKFFYYH